MREESIGRRYAAALFAQAQKHNTLSDTRKELTLVAESVDQVPKLKAVINDPFMTEEKKKAALTAVFGPSISRGTMAFLNLLIDKRRINVLAETEAEFTKMVRDFQNVEAATATSAVALSPDETAALVKSLEARTGKTIELTARVDPDVLGGVMVRIGDTVLDGTVRGNLERLRDALTAHK